MSGSGSGRFKLFDDTGQFSRRELSPPDPKGRTEYDELGNAVWVPYKGLGSKEAMAKLLNDETLAITEEDSHKTGRRIQHNRGGQRKGYDPYDSGLLPDKDWKKPKDLRALSKWIKQQKKYNPEG